MIGEKFSISYLTYIAFDLWGTIFFIVEILSSLTLILILHKNLNNAIFICEFQYPLQPDHTKLLKVSLMWHIIYSHHSTCCSLLSVADSLGKFLLGNCKLCTTTHGIIISLLLILSFFIPQVVFMHSKYKI